MPSPSTYTDITPVTLHRVLLLEFTNQSPRPPKSALRHLHAHDHFRKHRSADHATFRRAARLVRSPRAAV